ncbi:uncharacterized protein LOC6565032 [Drosophila grimshawi]|uniref:GH11885 n=1 Tax=Drosophila grimshawi TaxID=7222 RepID=B4JLE6_DROGR|nr:uncharacterized protein LOC6565032 [Drosophila grimshawi]EDW00399.1 GH11885 [Drosophila grimshawi]
MTSIVGLLVFGLMLLVYASAEDRSYSVELNSFDRNTNFENDDKWMDWHTLRMKKVGRNQYTLDGDFELKRNMGNEQKISLQVFTYIESAKQKGPLVMNMNKPFCQFVNEDEDTYPYLLEVSNLPVPGDCPFPKGKYTIENYQLATTFLPDDAPKGDYLLELNILDNEIPVAGIFASVTLT